MTKTLYGKDRDDGIHPPTKKDPKHRIVVRVSNTKRRKDGTARRRIATGSDSTKDARNVAVVTLATRANPERADPRLGYGLPSFRYRQEVTDTTGTIMPSSDEEVDDDPKEPLDREEIPSDTLMAIHSLLQSDQGLHIPLSNTVSNKGAISIQAVLEHQVMQTFVENHATSINNEMLELIRSNRIRRLYCHDTATTALVLTEDYVRAAWDAQVQYQEQQTANDTNATAEIPPSSHSPPATSEATVSWFLSNLQYWTGTTISMAAFLDQWAEGGVRQNVATELPRSNTRNKTTQQIFLPHLRQLLDMQLLIRDAKATTVQRNESFRLWLPQWGTVLKAWSEARKQLLTILSRGEGFGTATSTKRAGKAKEVSMANLLRQNRNSHISTQFLLNELLHKGRIRIVERPFGKFVQLVKDGDTS